ncbi:MAG TPA: glycosyltransferase family 2 protein, partial [Solirubrobacteraceae bacterium]|nr:glycosyltransferase family 2 protein [Solirubrobacteraceae bacterium]
MPSALDVSVVVCAYTAARWDDLCRSLESLRRQRVPPREIVLVVDHDPALLERARHAFPDVVTVANRHRRGLSGARNTGLELTRGAITAFLDDDARADPDWIERLLAAYDDPAVAGVGGAIEPDWSSGRPAWFPAEFDWVVGCTYRGMPECRRSVRNLIGANMSFRTELFRDVGGFMEWIGRVGTRPLGCEETEFCIRVARLRPGTRMVLEPSARVRHRVPRERARWRYFASRCWAEGRSKALVAQRAGAGRALATERSYVTSTVTRGVARGLGDAVLRRDVSGLTRAGAIAAGVGITTAGYVAGSVRRPSAPAAACA